MTTITSRSLPLIPLPIPLSQIINQSDGNNLILRSSPNEMTRMSPQSTNDMQNHDDGQSTVDGTSEARSSPLSSIQTDNYHKDDQDDDGDDRMSYCSDDSELSVGKEDIERTNNSEQKLNGVGGGGGGGVRSNSIGVFQQHQRRPSLDTTNEDTSNDSMRFAVSRLPQLAKDHDGLRFPLVRPSPTRFQEEFLRSSQLYAEELMKQQMSIVAAARGLNMSPKNQIENSALALRRNLEESVKVGFRPHIRLGAGVSDIDQPTRSPENFNFRGIHSHLNAISQITQNIQKITSPTLSMASRENSQSPPTNHHHLHPLHPLHQHHHHMMNNNLNDANLKFSIDNILKADFGRRITEPLKRTKSSSQHKKNSKSNQNKTSSSSSSSASSSLSNNNNAISKHSGISAIDLTASTASSTTISASAAAALAEKQNCSNSNDETSSVTSNSASNNSNGGDNSMIWPAWVYCTRYSDRPSSGMC